MASPSESFAIKHRLITTLDEWGFYLVLLFIWSKTGFAYPVVVLFFVTLYGLGALAVSYFRQWSIEHRLHPKETDTTNSPDKLT